MTTFSQLVDELVRETRRPDMLPEIAGYLNQTIRECHASPEKNLVALYASNLVEELLTASGNSLTWDIPDVGRFQHLQAVRYNSVIEDGEPVWAKPMTPGRGMNSQDYYFYRAGNYFSFQGFGGANAQVSIAYFLYPRPLKYKATADRKVTYDIESGYSYGPSLTTPEQRAAALELESNWLLMRWDSALGEGLRAKVYKRTGDETRAGRCYSFFMGQRNLLFTSESIGYGGWVD